MICCMVTPVLYSMKRPTIGFGRTTALYRPSAGMHFVFESFDAFYESIIAPTDRLHTPLSNGTIVEILRRNDILNLEIKSLQLSREYL